MMKHTMPYERPEAEALELEPMLDVCTSPSNEGFNNRPGAWSTSMYDPEDEDLMNL